MVTRPDVYRENPDPLSDVLAVLNARCERSAGLVASAPWSVRVEPYEGLKFNVLVRGAACLQVEGGVPQKLSQGDCFLLVGGRAFTVASDMGLPPVPASQVFADNDKGIARIGTLDEVHIVAGRMSLDPVLATFLTSALPELTVFRAASAAAISVQWLLQRISLELGNATTAGSAIADRMVEIVFIELLRASILELGGKSGWMAALADRRLARVLAAMHADPSRNWTLAQLAAEAHMSRSAFAEAFRSTVGMAPLQYLTRWRLYRAGHALRKQGVSISAAAVSAGYESDSAFVSAFKRLFGTTPARHAAARSGMAP